jgi:hypothetical protein
MTRLTITNAEQAALIAKRPFQEGQICRLDEDVTTALVEAGCAEVHLPAQARAEAIMDRNPVVIGVLAETEQKRRGKRRG